jgi:hypothetical protein
MAYDQTYRPTDLSMNASKTMAFVASAPRSGSTLLRLMLNAHPRIKTPGEFDFLFDLFGDDANCNSVGTASLDRFVEHLNQDRRFHALGAALSSKHSCDELIQHIVQHVSTDADVLVLNIHRNFLIAHDLFPQATFIHLVRDPRDCAFSCVQMGWAGNVHYGIEFWMEAERSWDRVAKTVTKENAAELRFEDLVTQPDA